MLRVLDNTTKYHIWTGVVKCTISHGEPPTAIAPHQ